MGVAPRSIFVGAGVHKICLKFHGCLPGGVFSFHFMGAKVLVRVGNLNCLVYQQAKCLTSIMDSFFH